MPRGADTRRLRDHATCNLKNGLRRAVEAFLNELDKMTLQDAVIAPNVAVSLLRIRSSESKEVAVPLANLRVPKRRSHAAGTGRSSPATPGPLRRSRHPA
jgi:hypothetical protein